MNTEQIRDLIDQALSAESDTGAFASYLEAQLPRLHESIRADGNQPAAQLVDFVGRYIRHIPDFVEYVAATAERAGVEAYVKPFLNLAEDYFLSPPELIQGSPDLLALLDEAYLAHRLIEEVNDRHIKHARVPLLPIDMTRSNLIVHAIIGEPLANRLDALVDHTVTRLVEQEHLFESAEFADYLKNQGPRSWSALWQAIPCLTDEGGVTLKLGRQAATG